MFVFSHGGHCEGDECPPLLAPPHAAVRSHVETLLDYKAGFNQDYYTFALTLLIEIVM